MTTSQARADWRATLGEHGHIDAAWRARVARGGLALVWEDEPLQASQLEAWVEGGARWLRAGDERRDPVQAGDRVMLVMDNGPAMLAAFLACQRLGAIAVPVSHRSDTLRLNSLIADCAPTVVLTDAGLPSHREQALGQLEGVRPPCPWPAALPDDTPDLPAPHLDADACALIQYTSGSTGDAKGVMISHAAALTNIHAFSSAMDIGPDDIHGSMMPLFHDMGLMCFGLAPLLLGNPLVLHRADALSLRAWLQAIERFGVTISGAPDTLLSLALRVLHEDERIDLKSLRMLICGSEPVRADTLAAFGRRWSIEGRLKPAYGMAELTLCATLTGENEDFVVDASHHVSNGRAIPGVSVRIRPERPGERHGEVMVRSPSAMSGYWGRDDATAAMFDAEGYLHTGDIGYLDDEQRLYILGRHRNMLIRGGEKHSPHDLETAASSVDGVRRAAVIQAQDQHARIVCLLETERHVLRDESRLDNLARQVRLAIQRRGYLSPDVCAFVPAGSIPVTDNGKVRHAGLRTLWQAGSLPVVWRDREEESDDVATMG